MSYQLEEQDWIDYLRIALPVIGLLLLLALFWFWASSLTGDGADRPELAVVVTTAATERVITPAAATQGAAGAGQKAAVAPAPTSADVPDVAPAPDVQDPNPGTGFAVDTIVVTTDDGVRMRRGPSTDTDVAQELGRMGTVELRVTGPGERDGQARWYPVTDPATGTSGYVHGDFLQRSE